jgi:hypothetical protein
MTNLALLDNMQLDATAAQGAGAALGLTVATLGQFAVPVGLGVGIFGSINEDDRLRNRGFAAAGIGVAMFFVGAAIAGVALTDV